MSVLAMIALTLVLAPITFYGSSILFMYGLAIPNLLLGRKRLSTDAISFLASIAALIFTGYTFYTTLIGG
jgi:hypothetical protein